MSDQQKQPDYASLGRRVGPTLFVGLGGTGKDVLLRVRRRFKEKWNALRYPIVAYRVIDTDADKALADKAKVDSDLVLREVWFDDSEICLATMRQDEVLSLIDNPLGNRHVSEWAPDNFRDHARDAIDGAGQIRPLGKLCFIHHYREMIEPSLKSALQEITSLDAADRTREMTGGEVEVDQNTITVVIVTSLAGGTGSGMFLDAAFAFHDPRLRQAIGHTGNVRVVGYLVLPGAYGEQVGAILRPIVYANGYAALKELDYYSSRDPRTGVTRTYPVRWWAEDKRQELSGPPFDTCYLVDNGAEGMGVVGNPGEICGMVADACFLDVDTTPLAGRKRSIRVNLDSWVKNKTYLDQVPASPAEGEEIYYQRSFTRRYYSLGFAQIYVNRDRITNAAAAILARDLLKRISGAAAIDDSVRETARERLTAAHLTTESAIRRVAGTTKGDTYFDWLQKEFAEARDAAEGGADTGNQRADAIAALLRAKSDERFEHAPEPEKMTPEGKRVRLENPAQMRKDQRGDIAEILDAQAAATGGGVQRARQTAEQMIPLLDAQAAELDQISKTPVESTAYDRFLAFLRDSDSLWLGRPTAIAVETRKAHRAAADVASARLRKLAAQCADDVVRNAATHVRKDVLPAIAAIETKLKSADSTLQDRVKVFLNTESSVRNIELSFCKDGDTEATLGGAMQERLKERYKDTHRDYAHVLDHLRTRFVEVLRKDQGKPQAGATEALQAAAGRIAELATAFCRRELEQARFAHDVDVVASLVAMSEQELQQKLDVITKRALPWIRRGGAFVREKAKSDFVFGTVGDDADVVKLFDVVKKLNRDWKPEPHTRYGVVFYSECTGFPIFYPSMIDTYREEYGRARSQEESFSNRHISRSWWRLPDIRTVTDQEARGLKRALEAFLKAVIVGMVVHRDDYYRANVRRNPIRGVFETERLGRSYLDAAERLSRNPTFVEVLEAGVGDWERIAGARDAENLHALVLHYDEHVFPYVEADDPDSKHVSPERDCLALIAKWSKTVCDRLQAGPVLSAASVGPIEQLAVPVGEEGLLGLRRQ